MKKHSYCNKHMIAIDNTTILLKKQHKNGVYYFILLLVYIFLPKYSTKQMYGCMTDIPSQFYIELK